MQIVGGVQSTRLYYELQQWGAGVVAVPTEHPEGIEVPREFAESIMLDPRIPLIGGDYYTATVKIFIDCLGKLSETGALRGYRPDSISEAAVLLAVADDLSRAIVAAPPQLVGGAQVAMRRNGGAIDILTGELYEHWPPDGFSDNGDIHSHNTMGAFFSGTDNRDDAGIPGKHLVFGSFRLDKTTNLWKWDIASSVVVNYSRYTKVFAQDGADVAVRQMKAHDLLDPSYNESVNFHPDVWNNIEIHAPRVTIVVPKDDTGKRIQRLPAGGGWGEGEYEALYAEQHARMRAEFDKQDDPFPEGYEWMDDLLTVPVDGSEPKRKDVPGQTFLIDMGDEEDEFDEITSAPVRWVKKECEAMLDCIDFILRMAPDEQRGVEIVTRLLNGTGLFTKFKARKIGKGGK